MFEVAGGPAQGSARTREAAQYVSRLLSRPKALELDPEHKGDAFLKSKFGAQSFKYSLVAIKSVPRQLYKERNFNLTFKLVDPDRHLVFNCIFQK